MCWLLDSELPCDTFLSTDTPEPESVEQEINERRKSPLHKRCATKRAVALFVCTCLYRRDVVAQLFIVSNSHKISGLGVFDGLLLIWASNLLLPIAV